MGRIKVCNFGRIMLKIFCWTTVILAIYLILGITGCYEKWFGGPAGIVKTPVYWLIRAGIGILVESIIFWIGIIMVYATSDGECLESCADGYLLHILSCFILL